MTVASTVDPSQLYYTLPGVTDADKVLLKDYVGITDYPRWSSYVEPDTLTEKATEILDNLGLALICESVRSAIAAYLVSQRPSPATHYDRAAHSRKVFASMRHEAIGKNLRYSGNDCNPQFFVPSGIFGTLPPDVQHSLLEATAVRMTERNLWNAAQTVAAGTNEMWPTAERAAQTFKFSLAEIIEEHFSLSEVDGWTDGVPAGYTANELQLEVLKARTIFPSLLEKEKYKHRDTVVWRPFNEYGGSMRPRNAQMTIRQPPATKETVDAILERRRQGLVSVLIELREHHSGQGTATKKAKRTWQTLILRHPGSTMTDGVNDTAEKGTDFYPALSEYIKSVSETGGETAKFVPFHYPSQMFKLEELTSGGTCTPLCRANTGTIHLYDSHGHRGWLRPLMKDVCSFVNSRIEPPKPKDEATQAGVPKLEPKIRDDASDASFDSNAETLVGDNAGDSSPTTLKVPQTPTTAKLSVRGRPA